MQKNTFYLKRQNSQIQKRIKLIFKVNSSEDGQRLDKFIKRKLGNLPQNLLEKLSRKGLIKVNEKKIKLSYKINVNDFIKIPNLEILIDNKKKKDLSSLKTKSKEILKKIIYKDNEKIIINKPYGIAVHKGSKTNFSIDDIKDQLRFDFKEVPRIVHRIDKETTGILIIARTYKSSVFLSKQFKDKNIKKFYIAILNGIPNKTKGIINYKINKKNSSETKFFILEKIKNKFSLALLQPITGRKRQLREHCYRINCPIIGDSKFFKKNKNKLKFDKLFLHAFKIEILNENNKKEVHFASLPEHIKEFLKIYHIKTSKSFINKLIKSSNIK